MTPREIDLILGHLRDLKEQLTEVEKHARETNGRVKTLELWRARMEGAKAALSWVPNLVTGVVSGGMVAVVAFALAQLP